MRLSIKYKITVFVTLIIVAVLSSQIICNALFAKSFYTKEKGKLLEKVYGDIVKHYSDDKEILSKVVLDYEENSNIKIIIFDNQQNIIYNTMHEQFYKLKDTISPLTNTRKPPFFPYEEVGRRKSYRSNADTLSLVRTIGENSTQRHIIIETPVAAIQESIIILNKFTFLITISGLIIGGIIAYFFAIKFTKPIKEIDKVACNVANLDFSNKVPPYTSRDEIGRLAQNINTMSDKLSSTIMALQKANIELQEDNDNQKKIDKMRKEFIANVSHELKTPLSLLLGYTEMLKNNIEGIDKAFYYEVIIDEANKMNGLVKNLLQVANMENNLTKLCIEIIDLSDLAHWILSKNDILFKEKGIHYESDLTPEAYVKIDKFYLDQAMKNYIINAISHTKTNRKIKISVKVDENQVLFSVFNEGENIPQVELDKIWENFYRIDQSRTRTDHNNVGLGLYIVQTIITAHGGNYGVTNLKNGVEFWFSLTFYNK